jgi:hypothetical protein
MKFRALDADGDWVIGNGLQSYLQAQDAIAMNIRTRLLSFLGDCFFDSGAGIDWFNLLGSKNEAALVFSVRSVILETEGVNSITDLSATLISERHLSLSYGVTTVYGRPVAGTLEFPLTPFDGISRFSETVFFNGIDTFKDVDVSASIGDAQAAIWVVYDTTDYSILIGAAQPTSSSIVRITINPAPPAGNFRLVGLA